MANLTAYTGFYTKFDGVRPEEMVVVHDENKHAFVLESKTAAYLENMLDNLMKKFDARENVKYWSLAFFCNNIVGLSPERTLFSASYRVDGDLRFDYQGMFDNWHLRKSGIFTNDYVINIRKRLLAIVNYIELHNSVVEAFNLTPEDHKQMAGALGWDNYVEVFGEHDYDDRAGVRDERNRTPDFKAEEV